MANYLSLEAAMAAGTTNMTAVRDNVALVDSIASFPSPVDWFSYNGQQVGTIYYSGSAYFGFGRSGPDLSVNYKSASNVLYIWYETGTLVQYNYLKLRWKGYTRSGSSYYTSSYLLEFDVFILDNGTIFLDVVANGSSSTYFTGTKALICGSENIPITIDVGNTGEWTFTAADTVNGVGWSLATGTPYLSYVFAPSGTAKFQLPGMLGVTVVDSEISWVETLEEGTSVVVKKSFDDEVYTTITNGSVVAPSGTTLTEDVLYLLLELSTIIPENTPVVSSLKVELRPVELSHSIQLEMMPLQRFESTHHLTVSYDGAGGLGGFGGPVEDFSIDFSPEDLKFKGDQHNQEHLEITDIPADGNLIRIYYTDVQDGGAHVEISNVSAVGNLIHIDDI